MTDRELKYFLNNTDPDLTLVDNKFGANALIHASINNRPNMVRLLLEEGGAEIDSTDYNGETALIGAARLCHQQVINILLEFGADRTVMGKFNKTAYDYASANCSSAFASNIGGKADKKPSSISGIVKAKSLFKKKKKTDEDGWPDDGWPEDDWPDFTPRGKKALDDLVKVKGILDYMDKYKKLPLGNEKKSFEKMGKVVGVWPSIHKKQKERAAEEERRKQEMKKNLQAKKKRAMAKLRTMSMLKKGGLEYRERMEEMDRKRAIENKIEEKENELIIKAEKQKEKDIDEGMRRKKRAIYLVIFGGNRSKNIRELKNDKEEVIIQKWKIIKGLLDAEENKIVAQTNLNIAKKKLQTIVRFKMGGKQLRDRMRAIELEEKRAKAKAERDARLAEEKKRKELEARIRMEKDRLLARLNKKEKALQDALNRERERKLAEEKRKNDLEDKLRREAAGGMVIGGTRDNTNIVKIDEKRGTISTADFKINFLKSRNCQIRKRANGTFFLFILTYKASDIKQLGRNNAIWFINRSPQSAGMTGGKQCPRRSCKDYAIFHSGGVRKNLFMSNLTVELGKNPKSYFEMYSSKAGNPTIKVDISECKNFPKR